MKRLSELETFALLSSAIAHDVGTLSTRSSSQDVGPQGLISLSLSGHPGVTNAFLIAEEHPEALLRNDASVLEVWAWNCCRP